MTETTEPLPAPPPNPETPVPEIKLHPYCLWLVILLSISTLFLIAVLGYWFGTRSSTGSPPPIPVTQSPTPEASSPLEPTPSIPPTSITGITWYESPKAIAALNLFKPIPTNGNYTFSNGGDFYEVGQDKDETKIIIAYVPSNGAMGESFFRLTQSNQGLITILIPKDEDTWTQEGISTDLLPGIKVATSAIEELELPESINIDQYTLKKSYCTGQLFSEVKDPEKITDTQYGPLYKILLPVSDLNNIKARKLFIKLPDGTINEYIYEIPFVVDDKTPQIDWDVTLKNYNFYQNFIPGCGSEAHASTPIITTNISSKNPLGKAGDDTIFTANDDNIISDLYNIYKVGRDYEGADNLLTLDEFKSQSSHYLWQDKLGDWQVFLNSDYSPLAECGKPVIYLYPEKPTLVSVQVDAAIRLSDPLYPSGGWQVLAHPNGRLDYQGQTYSSLFWEGLGSGPYPDYRDSGVVVSKSQLLSTLTSHLSQLGLNAAETQDFLDFWLNKFPDKPFIRLTWLGTADMDRLAPLTVTPKPDTRIRIFLEFEGLDQPVTLKPQTLSAPARSGFTLIEWGGLLLTPSN